MNTTNTFSLFDKYYTYLTTPFKTEEGSKQPAPGNFVKSLQECFDVAVSNQVNKLITSNNVLFWSDLHLFHGNIIKYCDRPWMEPETMSYDMLAKYNDTVQSDDVVIFGGDIAFKNFSEAVNILRQMNGIKILVYGNHDWDRKKKNFIKLPFDYSVPCIDVALNNQNYFISHYPVPSSILPEDYVNIHGHVHDRLLDITNKLCMCVEILDYAPKKLTDMQLANQQFASTNPHKLGITHFDSGMMGEDVNNKQRQGL